MSLKYAVRLFSFWLLLLWISSRSNIDYYTNAMQRNESYPAKESKYKYIIEVYVNVINNLLINNKWSLDLSSFPCPRLEVQGKEK